MINRDIYTEHYSKNLDSDVMLYPIFGRFTNVDWYPISFNMINDSDKLKTLFEYYGFEQRNAFKVGNLMRFDRAKRLLDIMIDRLWTKNNSDNVTISGRLSLYQSNSEILINNIVSQASKLAQMYKHVPPIRYVKTTDFDAYIHKQSIFTEPDTPQGKLLENVLLMLGQQRNGTLNPRILITNHINELAILNALLDSDNSFNNINIVGTQYVFDTNLKDLITHLLFNTKPLTVHEMKYNDRLAVTSKILDTIDYLPRTLTLSNYTRTASMGRNLLGLSSKIRNSMLFEETGFGKRDDVQDLVVIRAVANGFNKIQLLAPFISQVVFSPKQFRGTLALLNNTQLLNKYDKNSFKLTDLYFSDIVLGETSSSFNSLFYSRYLKDATILEVPFQSEKFKRDSRASAINYLVFHDIIKPSFKVDLLSFGDRVSKPSITKNSDLKFTDKISKLAIAKNGDLKFTDKISKLAITKNGDFTLIDRITDLFDILNLLSWRDKLPHPSFKLHEMFYHDKNPNPYDFETDIGFFEKVDKLFLPLSSYKLSEKCLKEFGYINPHYLTDKQSIDGGFVDVISNLTKNAHNSFFIQFNTLIDSTQKLSTKDEIINWYNKLSNIMTNELKALHVEKMPNEFGLKLKVFYERVKKVAALIKNNSNLSVIKEIQLVLTTFYDNLSKDMNLHHPLLDLDTFANELQLDNGSLELIKTKDVEVRHQIVAEILSNQEIVVYNDIPLEANDKETILHPTKLIMKDSKELELDFQCILERELKNVILASDKVLNTEKSKAINLLKDFTTSLESGKINLPKTSLLIDAYIKELNLDNGNIDTIKPTYEIIKYNQVVSEDTQAQATLNAPIRLLNNNDKFLDIFENNFSFSNDYKQLVINSTQKFINSFNRELLLFDNLNMNLTTKELDIALELLQFKEKLWNIIMTGSTTDFSKLTNDITVNSTSPTFKKLNSTLAIIEQTIVSNKRLREVIKPDMSAMSIVNEATLKDKCYVLTDKVNHNMSISESDMNLDRVKKDLLISETTEVLELKSRDVFMVTAPEFESVMKSFYVEGSLIETDKESSDMLISQVSFTVLKSPDDISIGKIYMSVKGNNEVLINLNQTLPIETAYKVSTVLNDIIVSEHAFKGVALSNFQALEHAQKLALNELRTIEDFEKLTKHVILNNKDLASNGFKNVKEIFTKYNFLYQEMFKRWYFMPSDGPYDPIILPLDYPYATKPIKGVVDTFEYGLYPNNTKVTRERTNVHPMPNGSDKALTEVKVDIHILANVIDFCYELWYANSYLYDRYTPSQALKHFVNLIYEWLTKYIPDREYKLPEYYPTSYSDDSNPEIYREDYWRLYRWIRWYAEAFIQNIPKDELNSLKGNDYVKKLINDLVKYFNDHHGVYGVPGEKVFDKVKGVRHRWLTKYINKLL